MDGFELFHLGRRLTRLGERAIPSAGFKRLSGPTRAVLFDIVDHPDSSISDITDRIHFPQSQVSACVARLRDQGVLETRPDPKDRRRTLVRLTEETLKRATEQPTAEIDAALAEAIIDPADLQRAKDALDVLAAVLRPTD